jgi:hypothetical protein
VSTIAMPTAKGAGIILAGIIGGVALVFTLVFLWAVYMAGLLWVSKHVLDYLNIAAVIALQACILILLPCALFRVTRKLCAYGFLISSVIFGLSTWVLALLVTFQHWGVTGLIVGVMFAGVGIVPLGTLASAFNGDWLQVVVLALGLVLTFGAQAMAFTLAASADRDEAGICSNLLSEFRSVVGWLASCVAEKWRAVVRIDRLNGLQIMLTALCVLLLGGLAVHEALHPSRSNYDYPQLVADLNTHPVASILGALLPAVILSPLIYWMVGRSLRRNAARFKVCEHCAEKIKSAANVCRYCGRDIAPANLVEVRDRQQEEDGQPELELNQLGQMQGAAVAATSIDTIGVNDRKLELRMPQHMLMVGCVLGFVFLGSLVIWIDDKQRTSILAGIPSFDEIPSTSTTAGSSENADAAYGRGDYRTALRLLRPLAEQSNSAAQTTLGLMYYEGRGAQQNSAEAVKWWRKAAKQGYAQAQYNLGFMYDEGGGLQQNYVLAHMWYNLAAKQGNKDASKSRNLVAQLMTPVQLGEAQRLAREWKSKSTGGDFSASKPGMFDDLLSGTGGLTDADVGLTDTDIGLINRANHTDPP